MTKWFEVFAADTSDPPYILVLVRTAGDAESFAVHDPQENNRLIERFGDYRAARDWLNEDDFCLVTGRAELAE